MDWIGEGASLRSASPVSCLWIGFVHVCVCESDSLQMRDCCVGLAVAPAVTMGEVHCIIPVLSLYCSLRFACRGGGLKTSEAPSLPPRFGFEL